MAQEYQENCHQIFCTNVLFLFPYASRYEEKDVLFCLRFPTNYWNVLPHTYTKGLQNHFAEMHENENKA